MLFCESDREVGKGRKGMEREGKYVALIDLDLDHELDLHLYSATHHSQFGALRCYAVWCCMIQNGDGDGDEGTHVRFTLLVSEVCPVCPVCAFFWTAWP